MRAAVIACLLLLLAASTLFPAASAQPVAMLDLTASPTFWRGFRPLVIAFGDGDPARAVSYMRAGTKILRSVDADLDLDEATRNFQDRSQKHMEKFDLRSFFKLLPETEGAFRYFAFKGDALPASYRVRVAKGHDFEVNAAGKRRDFGASSGVFRMRQVKEDDQRYQLQWRTGAGFGELNWSSIVAALSDMLELFDLPKNNDDTPVVLRAADVFLKRSQPNLDAEDRAVLAVLWGSFPEVSRLLSNIGTAHDVVGHRDAETGVTKVNWHARWNLNGMAEQFPKAAEYFRDLGKLVELKLRIVDGNGHKLCDVTADTEKMQSRIEAFVRNGKVIPSKKGEPLLDRPARFEKMRTHVDLHFQAYSVHIYVKDLRIEMKYDERSTGAAFSAQIVESPQVLVRGAAFGFLPTGMLDWFIPGDMESLARKLFDIATQGNEGRGVEARYRFERPEGSLATLDGTLGVEVLDSALIRFAMAIAADRVVPDKKQSDDLKRLGVAYRDAVDADIVRFGKHGKLPSVPLSQASIPAQPSVPATPAMPAAPSVQAP